MTSSIHLEIPEHHRNRMRVYYQQHLKELDKEREEVLELLQQLDKPASNGNGSGQLSIVPNVQVLSEVAGPLYNVKWPFTRKTEHLIKYSIEPLTTGEIVDSIIDREPHLKPQRTKIVRTVSSYLSTQSKENGKFEKNSDEVGHTRFRLRNKKPL